MKYWFCHESVSKWVLQSSDTCTVVRGYTRTRACVIMVSACVIIRVVSTDFGGRIARK
jgi:hypothetical protein